MTTAVWGGAALGGMLASGLLLVWRGLPLPGRTDFLARVEPYLDPIGTRARERDLAPLHRLGFWLRTHTAGALGRLLGGDGTLRERLRRAGHAEDVEAYRVQQALWGLAGCCLALALGGALWWARDASLVAVAVITLAAALGAALGRDWALGQQARRRERRLVGELPAVAELLALAVTAGESTAEALERVSRMSSGELSRELELCLAEARTGATLPQALHGLSVRTASPPVTRFVDGLVVALERGTPLGDVLRAQAADAREAGRQALIEEGGRREIAMMIPVVFLVLPVTVLFAVYPGFSMLRVSL